MAGGSTWLVALYGRWFYIAGGSTSVAHLIERQRRVGHGPVHHKPYGALVNTHAKGGGRDYDLRGGVGKVGVCACGVVGEVVGGGGVSS